jgi:class 3 adenylate cyclase
MPGLDPENIEIPVGTHQLAAVMFTDIVGFSSRTHDNEAETLMLAAKDLRHLQTVAEKHHGRVLKNMGDGVLIHFLSATDAVRCGLEFQTSMQAGYGLERQKSPLQHRVGIHLGDMYVSESEVMGDGVNIASRLQAIAEPGGICISQTVYDIIKHKVALRATQLGPKELKNISHAVNVYKILINAIEPKGSRKSSVRAQWTESWKKIAAAAMSYGHKIREAVGWIFPTFKSRVAAVVVVAFLICAGIAGFFLPSPAGAQPLKELTTAQVETALVGHSVNLGKFLFLPSRGEIRRREIVAITFKKTVWDAKARRYHSTYAFTLRVRGSKQNYQAIIEHDGSQNVLDVAVSGPF